MNSIEDIFPAVWARKRPIALSALLLGFVLAVFSITGYFRPSSEASALRRSVMNTAGGEWHKKIAVRVGFFTTGLIRFGSQFFNVPGEARAVIDSVRGGEFGIYICRQEPTSFNRGAVFAAADKSMKARGWIRVVGVVHDEQLVAVYMPRKAISTSNVSCCVMVLHEEKLILASAHGNLEPLLHIAENRLNLSDVPQHLAL
jgi:hypothetical protein